MKGKVIYKYEVADPEPTIMPWDAVIKKFGFQNDVPMVWAIVDPKQSITSERKLRIVATGQEYGPDCQYWDTTFEGAFVWHLVEQL